MIKNQTPKSFWNRVKKVKSGCMEWQGSTNNTGYGTVSIGGIVYTVHRAAAYYIGLVSSIKAPKLKSNKTHVLHTCDNRKCCNPDHFFLGSYSDNQKDAYKKGRRIQPKGEHHANAKLSNKKASIVRNLYDQGCISCRELSEIYKVSISAIERIVKGETYNG